MPYNVLLILEDTLSPLTYDANGILVVNASNTLFQVVDAFLDSELAALKAANGPVAVGYDATDTISIVLAQDTFESIQQTQLSLANAISVINFAPNIAYVIQARIAPNATIVADANALLATLKSRNVPIVSSGNIDQYNQLAPYIPVQVKTP
jgi:hypothetical protein